MKKQMRKNKEYLMDIPKENMTGPISAVVSFLQEIENRAISEAWSNLQLMIDPWHDDASFTIIGDRLETEEEVQERIKIDKEIRQMNAKRKQAQKDKEYAEYLRLKGKYEKRKG